MENRFLDIHKVVSEMTKETRKNIHDLSVLKAFVLAVLAGSFITFGALLSILLSAGIEQTGIVLLLQGLGFSAGFFMVIITGALLFSETNIALPASVLNCTTRELIYGVTRFWIITIIGNIIGAYLIGGLINFAHVYPQEIQDSLSHVLDKKLYYFEEHTALSWSKAIISGIFGNMLVGIAAVFAVMGKTMLGKYLPVFLAVLMFVAANFQHSPANMGYFSLGIPMLQEIQWSQAIMWNLIPAAIGNILGGFFLVVLPLWYALTDKQQVMEEISE